MRAATASCLELLGSRLPYWKADLFTITLVGGTVYNWTDFDQPLTYSGTTWLSQVDRTTLTPTPLLSRSKLEVKNTVEVPSLEVKMLALDTAFVGGLNVKTQLHNGYFDGAQITLQRIFMPTPGDTSLVPILIFGGRMSNSSINESGAILTFKGANILFNQYLPRNLYQASCLHNYCDAGCTLLESANTLTAQVVGVGPTARMIPWSGAPANQTTYTLGKLTMTSGAAIGQVRTVKFVGGGVISLSYPLYNVPSAGDTFSILNGCDKTYNSGSGQSCTDHANTQHYRGFPFVPPAYVAT